MTTTPDDESAPVFRAAHNSPTEFSRRFLDLEPTDQQQQLYDAVARPGSKTAVRSGHGTGKSTALATLALWFLTTRHDALVPCTAPTAHQLQDVLWREMRRLVARMPPRIRALYLVSQDRVQLAGNPGAMIVGRTARPEAPDALQGFHSPEILFIVDEAAGVHNTVFEVARGALSTADARVVMAANPTRLTGYFFNAFNLNRDAWTRLQFSCLDSPLVAPNYAKEIAAEYGESSDMYRIRVLGEFPLQGMDSIIPMDRVLAAFDRTLPRGAVDYAPAVLGVDPAWEGRDRSAVFLRQGIWAKLLLSERGLRGDELARRVVHFRQRHDAEYVFVDKGGVGASCCDFLRNARVPFIGVSFAERPSTDDFVNRRAEMWWRMREWFHEDVAVPRNDDLLQDLVGPEYLRTDLGKIQLESKHDMRGRGLSSPDLADALALTFAMPVRNRQRNAVVRNPFSTTFNPFSGVEGRQ